MGDALSAMNAIVYEELGRRSTSNMDDIHLSLDTECAKGVPNRICGIFTSVSAKQLAKINKTLLC